MIGLEFSHQIFSCAFMDSIKLQWEWTSYFIWILNTHLNVKCWIQFFVKLSLISSTENYFAARPNSNFRICENDMLPCILLLFQILSSTSAYVWVSRGATYNCNKNRTKFRAFLLNKYQIYHCQTFNIIKNELPYKLYNIAFA